MLERLPCWMVDGLAITVCGTVRDAALESIARLTVLYDTRAATHHFPQTFLLDEDYRPLLECSLSALSCILLTTSREPKTSVEAINTAMYHLARFRRGS